MFFRTTTALPQVPDAAASGQGVVCEELEPRELLAADLVATEIRGKFPTDLLSGQKGHIPGLSVNLMNSGNAEVKNAAVVMRVFASTDGTLDAGDFQLAEVTKKINLKPGNQRTVPLKMTDVPPGIPQNAYRLITQVDVTNVVPEDNEGNNTIASTGTINIGPPFVNLTATKAFVRPPVRQGKFAELLLTVLNAGNVNAKGNGIVSVTFRPINQTTGGTPINVPVKINIASKKTKQLKGRIAVPADLVAGDYTVIATITSTLPFGDATIDDNTATVAPVTVRT